MSLLMLFNGCAAKKLIVRNADTLLEHQIKKRIPLYSKQKEKLSEDIKLFLTQQRDEARKLLPAIDEITLEEPEKIQEHYQKIVEIYDQIALSFSSVLAKYIAQLDTKQQKDFFETLANENREMEKTESSERIKKIKDRFKTFFGSVNDKQKQLITNLQENFEVNNKKKLEKRIELHSKFKEILNQDLSPASRQEYILNAFKLYQKKAHNHEKNIETVKTLLPTISKEQKEVFRKRVAEVKEVLKLYLETDY